MNLIFPTLDRPCVKSFDAMESKMHQVHTIGENHKRDCIYK